MLTRVHEDVSAVAAPHSFFGIRLGTRMTVLQLPDGSVLLHSPVAATPERRESVAALGPVSHIVCPNLYHHMYAGPWAEAYPEALVHGPVGLARKRPDLRINHTLGETPHPDWDGVLVPVPITGSLIRETVFVHARSRTIISSDLTENFTTSDHWPTRMYLHLAGLHGTVGWSRPLRILYWDRRAARRSVDALLEHDFDRVVIAHGSIIDTSGKDVIRQTFRFLGGS